MKLRTKIAGTLALPLALAVAANVNAAQITDELQVSGFIAATADWSLYDKAYLKGSDGVIIGEQNSDVDFGLSLGTSRIGVTYVKNGVTYMYENDWAGGGKGDEYRLRHAVIKYDGWEAGYTWSGFANRTALAETIDATGPTSFSANANRTAKLGKSFNLAKGMSVGIFFEDHSHALNSDKNTSADLRNVTGAYEENGEIAMEDNFKANSAIPDITLNFNGDFNFGIGATKVFAAARLVNINDTKYESKEHTSSTGTTTYYEFAEEGAKPKTKLAADFALGLSQDLIDDTLNLKLAVLSLDKAEAPYSTTIRSKDGRDLGIQLGAQYKFNDQIRTNLVVEQVSRDDKNSDTTAFWLNGFYTMNNGWEWGAEFRYVSADTVDAESDYGNTKTKKVSNKSVNGLGDKDMRVSLLAKYSF